MANWLTYICLLRHLLDIVQVKTNNLHKHTTTNMQVKILFNCINQKQ